MPPPALSPSRIAELLEPYFPHPQPVLVDRLSIYLRLLLRWNARINLTAIRDPEQIVTRHFGESLFVARHLPPCETLLDLGSGAGFPGIPIQLALPRLQVTLGEARKKKAAFLREAVRTLGLQTEVWGDRVEAMPPERVFDVVAMRAVDDPAAALLAARQRLKEGGVLALLTADPVLQEPALPGTSFQLPHSERVRLQICS